MGKTSTIELFAEYYGYHLEVLRGNSTSETEIMGYDVVNLDPGAKSTKHLRPSWFDRILNCGKKTLLFLDEITTASAPVQASILHLVFERTVGDEHLPSDTLIVSAGNYSQSLSSEFGLIPPLMNRFCIINIIPDLYDLDIFLSHLSGSTIGESLDWREVIFRSFKEWDDEGISVDSEVLNIASEYIERSIRETTKTLITKGRGLDLGVSDMQSIYSDTSLSDSILLGFVSLRTLGYLVRVSISAYKLFGSHGISGNPNFLKVVEGLVGIGLSRKSSEIVPTVLTRYYYDSISQVLLSVEKIKSKKMLEYESFLRDLPKNLPDEELLRVHKILTIICKDHEISKLEKPLESDTLDHILGLLVYESPKASKVSKEDINPETLAGKISRWNILLDIFKTLWFIIDRKPAYYTKEISDLLEKTKTPLVSDMVKLDSYIKSLEKYNPESTGLLPKLKKELVV
jgi:hypothetical protein